MANTKKDTKGRKLNPNEDQMKDGRYRFRYTDHYGKRQAVYAWKLIPTDRTPKGKKEDLSLREKIKNICGNQHYELFCCTYYSEK